MNEEEKQALIKRCKNRIAFYKAAGNTGTFDADTLRLTEIALNALTSPAADLADLVPDELTFKEAIDICRKLYPGVTVKHFQDGANWRRSQILRNIEEAQNKTKS